MAGAAFQPTERQFVSLLDLLPMEIPIHVCFMRLPGLSQAESVVHILPVTIDLDALLETHLDGPSSRQRA